jgi:hypothetical protein
MTPWQVVDALGRAQVAEDLLVRGGAIFDLNLLYWVKLLLVPSSNEVAVVVAPDSLVVVPVGDLAALAILRRVGDLVEDPQTDYLAPAALGARRSGRTSTVAPLGVLTRQALAFLAAIP